MQCNKEGEFLEYFQVPEKIINTSLESSDNNQNYT